MELSRYYHLAYANALTNYLDATFVDIYFQKPENKVFLKILLKAFF